MVKPGEIVDSGHSGSECGRTPYFARTEAGPRRSLGEVAEHLRWARRSKVRHSLTKFGAFVQLTEGVEGMIHVSEISAEKRIIIHRMC